MGTDHADLLGGDNALQIHVQHHALGRVHLHVFQNRRLLLLADLHGDDAGEESFLLHLTHQRIALERQRTGRLAAAINDRGHFSFAAQAAARTFPCIFTKFRDQLKTLGHGFLLVKS